MARWGFPLFCLICAAAFARLLHEPYSAHYRIFTGAGRALWAGVNPHGTDFGTGLGYWFYSPTCGLFVFGPLALLPEKIGLFLYLAISWVLFVLGVTRFASAAVGKSASVVHRSRVMGFFWLGIAPQVFTAIVTSKLEISMVGLLLLGCAWLLEGRRIALAAIVAAMLLNWKLQPLPSLGLIALACWIAGRERRFPAYVAGATPVWFALPFAVAPAAFMRGVYARWDDTLSSFVRAAWGSFDNLFSFILNALGLPLTYRGTQVISAGVAVLFALGLGGCLLARRRAVSAQQAFAEGVTLALGLGAVYTVALSPLSQNNAYVLYAPLLLLCLLAIGAARGAWRSALGAVTLGAWFVTAFAYSDLIPVSLRNVLRHWSVKPASLLALALVQLFYFYRFRRENRELLSV